MLGVEDGTMVLRKELRVVEMIQFFFFVCIVVFNSLR